MSTYFEEGLLTSRFEEALVYANHLHSKQTRKVSHAPYMVHLMSVAALVLEDGGNEDEAISGLLHDAIEDQGGKKTLKEIKSRFGSKVAEIVEGCSNLSTTSLPWKERKEEFINKLDQAIPEVIRVEVADKLHNARSILYDYREYGSHIWSKFNGGKEGTIWYYRKMINVLKRRSNSQLVQELDKVVRDIANLENVSDEENTK